MWRLVGRREELQIQTIAVEGYTDGSSLLRRSTTVKRHYGQISKGAILLFVWMLVLGNLVPVDKTEATDFEKNNTLQDTNTHPQDGNREELPKSKEAREKETKRKTTALYK